MKIPDTHISVLFSILNHMDRTPMIFPHITNVWMYQTLLPLTEDIVYQSFIHLVSFLISDVHLTQIIELNLSVISDNISDCHSWILRENFPHFRPGFHCSYWSNHTFPNLVTLFNKSCNPSWRLKGLVIMFPRMRGPALLVNGPYHWVRI